MMAFRRADGLLKNIRQFFKELTADEKTAEATALNSSFGGAWEYVALESPQYGDALNLQQSGRAAYLVNGSVIGKPVMSATLDKTSISADDVEIATLTVNVGDANFVGSVILWLNPPETAEEMHVAAAVAGVATFEITTEQEGTHEIRVDVHEYGTQTLTLEGVE